MELDTTSMALCFSPFASMVDILGDDGRLRGWPCCRLTGATNRVQRVVNVRAFNEEASPLFVFLMTTRAGGLGINLTAADTVIFYDSDWNPTVDQQAMDRCHRMGQLRPVRVLRLARARTGGERMIALAAQKHEAQRATVEEIVAFVAPPGVWATAGKIIPCVSGQAARTGEPCDRVRQIC